MPAAPRPRIQYESSPISASFETVPLLKTTTIEAKGPIELATSLAPCANESQHAVRICKYRMQSSVFSSNFSAFSWIANTAMSSSRMSSALWASEDSR